MRLSRRLAAAVVLLVVALSVSGVALLLMQRSFAMGQLDARVSQLAENPRLLRLAAERGADGTSSSSDIGDVYVGLLAESGDLQTLMAPTSDPDLVPDLTGITTLPQATAVRTRSGHASSVRAITVDPTSRQRQSAERRNQDLTGRTIVVAVSTQSVEESTRRLLLTMGGAAGAVGLALGLCVWWVHRLGLRPIAAMTTAADQIAAGSRDRKVPLGAPGTEAHRLGQALNAMLDSVQETENRMRRFVSDASHELRTPLTTLRGYSALHQDPSAHDPVASADAMRRIHSEARRMNRIVDALLDLNALDESGVTHRQHMAIGPLLEAVVADLRMVAPERRIDLEIPDGLPAVHADPDRVTQAVLALTSNALRHTPRDARIDVRAAPVPGAVRIEVADTGPGIEAAALPHLFERFYRVDKGRARATGGSGLGLAIVASIAIAHGGRYGVDSQPGVGSTFWIEFPTAAV